MKEQGLEYFQGLMQFFVKKGKKPRLETLFRFFFKERIKKNKQKKEKFLDIMNQCHYRATTFVGLKTRKKRKRILYRVTYLEKENAEKKALMLLSKMLPIQKSDFFMLNWEKELKLAALKKSVLTLKKKEIHKTAKRFAPRRWKKWARDLKKAKKKKRNLLTSEDLFVAKWEKSCKLKKFKEWKKLKQKIKRMQ